MSLATTISGAAARVLKSYGAAATLTHKTTGTHNVSTGLSTPTTATATVRVMLDASSTQGLGFTFGENLVQAGDLKATFSSKGLSIVPAPGDTLALASGTFVIVAVRPAYVQDDPVLYECLVRR